MKKDEQIESAFREYFDGNDVPEINLAQAKRALTEKKGATWKGLIWKVASAFACLALVALLVFQLIPFGGVTYYSVADVTAQSVGYQELSQKYGEKLGSLSSFEFAQNASARYTLYSDGEEDLTVRADLKFVRGFDAWTAVVYLDLTDGARLPDQVKEYADLQENSSYRGNKYVYEKQYLNGEWVSRAQLKTDNATYYAEVMGRNSSSLSDLIKILCEKN